MPKKNRDDFSEKTKGQIAKRAGWLCSYPTCRKPTVGATSDGDGEINVGTAAHICAAAPGGPRYDPNMTPQERSSAKNGIWTCRDHGKAIDSTDPEFTVERLREWKQQAQKESWQRVLRHEPAPAHVAPPTAGDAHVAERVRTAAIADLNVFRRTAKWPATSVPLSLQVTGFDAAVTTDALAGAVTTLDDLILVAPPGMGKTTTLFQIAAGILAQGSGTPLIVPLGDWATEGATVLASILTRPAFAGVSEAEFRKAAEQPGMVLLLDGWNELDADARARVRVQVSKLKAELPELSLVVSTRKQSLDVPLVGTRVDLQPLSEDQQLQIAVALRGDVGARMVDQAWRTAGVRELVTIPLYLTALLSLPEDAAFPTTKEAVLRHFVAAHENDPPHAEALRKVARGFQQDYLDGLAVFATRTANTAISDSNARSSISGTETLLIQNGQITIKTQPDNVLDVLVSSHVLMRAGDTPGVSFQHQQFQEWYASHSVERRIVTEIDDPGARLSLKAEIFDQPTWEEAILFAIERLSRGDKHQQTACGEAILAAFDVDPMLAAEMIFRATEEVWAPVAGAIQDRVSRWHAPGTVDRAVRFMLNSGRPEFLDILWPLLTHENDQVSLKALRNSKRLRPSVLGKDAAKNIKSLPDHARSVLLHELAMHGNMEGIDLAADIAKDDPVPEVQSMVVDALSFRRADRHIVAVLKRAPQATYDLIARKGLIEKLDDEVVQAGLAAAHKRMSADKASTPNRLRLMAYPDDETDRSAEVTEIIATMEIERGQDPGVHAIYEVRKRYPHAVAQGLLTRLRRGAPLFHGSDDILAAEGLSLDDDDLYSIAMAATRHDERAEAAASVLGPKAVGRMIDALADVASRLRVDGKYDEAAGDRRYEIQSRIAHTPGASLVAAVQERSTGASSEMMSSLAELLSRRPEDAEDSHSDQITRARPFSAADLAAIRELVQEWGNRMLAGPEAERRHKAHVATLASHAPSVELLPLLKRMLDDNLRRYRAFREQASAAGWTHGNAVNEARQPMTHEYQRAFLAIHAPETASLMKGYLADEHFGELAAQVLAAQWRRENEPPLEKRFAGGVDWEHVGKKRATLAQTPDATSEQGDAIFAVIDSLIGDGSTEAEKKLAISLAVVAARLPHGRRDGTIARLMELAQRRSRAALLLSLVLAGHVIDIELVKAGLAEVQEAGQTQRGILSEGYELREWLRLLPFTNRPAEALAIVQSVPAVQIKYETLDEMISAFGHAPGVEAEKALLAFADSFPRLRENYSWRTAIARHETSTSARQLVDMAATGRLGGRGTDRWYLARQIGALLDEYPDLRRHVYDLLRDGATTPGLTLLAEAVAESPDAEGLLLLLRLSPGQARAFWSQRTIESVVTDHVPVENWKGAYDVVPAPAADLRRMLLAMTTDGGPADAAARCLNEIDRIRDEHGWPEGEPRHPDLASGKGWPILTPDPDATPD